ncbi:MAG: hypothetical protein LIP09_00770 [Bacteroidales bacterium]|nr:hypothetical protein [Bacteroidales bacterium]
MELANLNEWSREMLRCRLLALRLEEDNLFGTRRDRERWTRIEAEAAIRLITSSPDAMERYLLHDYGTICFRNHEYAKNGRGKKLLSMDAYFVK